MSEYIDEMAKTIRTNSNDLDLNESFCRLVRTRMIIDQLAGRRDAF